MSILRDYITYAKANFQVLPQKSVAIRFLFQTSCFFLSLLFARSSVLDWLLKWNCCGHPSDVGFVTLARSENVTA
jgi:hypothetical protein